MPGVDANLIMLDQIVRVVTSELLKAAVWLPLLYLVAIRPLQKSLRGKGLRKKGK